MNHARIAAEALRYRLDLVRGPLVNITDWDIETMAGLYQSVMSPYPRLGTGEVNVQIAGTVGRPGITFELRGATGKRYYEEGTVAGGDLTWRLDLTATTAKGIGGFVEVTPGIHEIEIGGATSGCAPTVGGWPSEAENRVRVPVRENYVSIVVVACSPPP